ncbi:MAG: hypothetical protein Kow0077_07230 [Anaerolineae bacterium]
MSAKILIVDDTPDTIQMLTVWLQSDGYETVVASDPAEAIRVALREKPVLALVDTHILNRDGIIVARELRSHPATQQCPVVLLTSSNPVNARSQVLMAGAVDYIAKPISLRDLSDTVQRVLGSEAEQLTDTVRVLDEIAYTAIELVPCDLAWLFSLESNRAVLAGRAVASAGKEAALERVSAALGIDIRTLQLPVVDDGNPLASAIARRYAVLNLPVEQLQAHPPAQLLYQALRALDTRYLNLVPLNLHQRTVGLLVMGFDQKRELDPAAWRVITMVSGQAAMALDYGFVSSHLAEQEEIMKAEHAFLTTVLESMGDALIVVGEYGQIEYVNNRLLRMTGYTRDELTGQQVEILFHPDDRQELVYGLLHQRGSTMKFDQRLYTRGGDVIPVLLSRSSFSRIDPDAPQQVLVLSDLSIQKNREVALERYSQQLQALNQAAEAISSSLSPQEVIQEILNSAVKTVGAQGASVLLRSRDNADELYFAAAVGPESERLQGMRIPIDRGIAGWVVREAKSQLVEDTALDERFYRDVDQSSGLHTRSIVAVPLIVSERVIGVLEVINKLEGRFDHVDVDLLESIAGTAAVAIENARLFEQTRRRLNDLGTLLDASAAVSSTLDFGSVLELIARRLLDALQVARCQITAWDRTTNTLESLAEVVDAFWTYGTGPETAVEPDSLRKDVLTGGQVQFAALADPACGQSERQDLLSIGQQAVMYVPLALRNQTVGLIEIYDGLHAEGFSQSDIDHIQRIVQSWVLRVERHRATDWYAVDQVNDLCNLLHAVPGVMWVRVEAWDAKRAALSRIRETGFALWIDQDGVQRNLDDFPTMRRVLTIAQPRVMTREGLESDPHEQALLTTMGGEVCLLAPLIVRGQPEGLVKLIDLDPARRFDEEQISLCQGIANVVGNALENAHLYQRLERRAEALEAAYADLKQADQLKEDLLQNLSHEIQTPLQHVLGYLELMYNEAFGPLNPEQRDKLAFVLERARHLSELARNIITMQALQAQQLNLQPTAVEEVLLRAVSAWEAVAARRKIALKLAVPEGIPRVMADPGKLEVAVGHLLSNAVKFSPNEKPVEVSVADRDGVIAISVQDYGAGIPASYHEHIFKRFYQVDGGVARKYGGAGLGLAIVQEIVTMHGGRVWVESEPGRGSRFTLTIPKADTISAEDFRTPTNLKRQQDRIEDNYAQSTD